MFRKKYIEKTIATITVLLMVMTGLSAMMTPVVAENGEETPTLRVFGEENAVYPTQSYTDAEDFIYTSEEDPFDPGIIGKDSITFNPAFLSGNAYNINAQGDASEKVFFRTFYEPNYGHEKDSKMYNCNPDIALESVGSFDAIGTETTYGFVGLNSRDPVHGYEDASKMYLPYKSTSSSKPGMDTADILDVSYVKSDENIVGGAIEVEKEYNGHILYETKTFMDHKIHFESIDSKEFKDDKLLFELSYVGNQNEHAKKTESGNISEGETLYFNRANKGQTNSDATHRWYIHLDEVAHFGDSVYIKVNLGRRLVAGETFYVDGVRYDMPALYVNDCDGFGYITFQSPLPKYNGEEQIQDFSHVSSQYLACIPENENIWMLPPFDSNHWMVDDIGLATNSCSGGYKIPVEGCMLNDMVGPLQFYYVDETTEDRFDSNIAERYHGGKYNQEWLWYNIYSRPNKYTEFVLPDQETESHTYKDCSGHADGNEYLFTSSFIANNSQVDMERTDECKADWEHEIYDRTNDVARQNDQNNYYGMPRLVFEYDASNFEDLYINEYNGDASVRTYGHNNAEYPTQSYIGSGDFIYNSVKDPFDPGVIEKDSITFNPAFISGDDYNINAQGDAHEKAFLRAFYEPYYSHPVDSKMDAASEVNLEGVGAFHSIVTETTYNFIGYNSKDPIVGYEDNCKMYLPYKSTSSSTPGMDAADIVDVTKISRGKGNVDGSVVVTKKYADTDLIGETKHFMDHKVKFQYVENDYIDQEVEGDKLFFDIS
ncbi:MAG: hypothetical protein V5A68_08025, partial [Candidatus Thermoplasmatota archaeon]